MKEREDAIIEGIRSTGKQVNNMELVLQDYKTPIEQLRLDLSSWQAKIVPEMELIAKVYDELLSFNVNVEDSIKKISDSQVLIADFFNTTFKTEIDNVLIRMAEKNNNEIDKILKTLTQINRTLNDDNKYKKLDKVSGSLDNLKKASNA